MQNGNVALSILVGALLVGALFGFYYTLDQIGALNTRIDNLEISLEFATRPTTEQSASSTGVSAISSSTPGTITIPSAIILETQSSPALQPQSRLTVTLENVQKKPDGTIAVGIKVFTSDASGYTAFDPRSFLEIIDLAGGVRRVADVIGQFGSMPSKSAVSGVVLFQEDSQKNTIILQISADNILKHYEFNFSDRTYKEVVLG